MNETSEKRVEDEWLDDAIRSLLCRAGSDAPTDSRLHGGVSEPPRTIRPRWLAVAASLLALVAIGSTIALRSGGGGSTNTLPVLRSSPETIASTSTSSTAPAQTTTGASTAPTTVQTMEQLGERQTYGTIETGQGIAVIRIPAIDVAMYVVAGDGAMELKVGVGHVSSTPAPGQYGNSVLVGHRTTHLAPFEDLDQLRPGDVIEIDTVLGGRYTYRVSETVVVNPADYETVMSPTTGQATLSLITCTPKFTSELRLVVRATLIEELSSPAGRGEVNYGRPAGGSESATPRSGCDMAPPER